MVNKISSLIEQKTKEVIAGANSPQDISQRIASYVRDYIPYYLDEWNVSADEVLQKGKGMCSGKALLAAEMHKAAGISVRFIVIKILGEQGLFTFIERWLDSSEASPEEKQSLLNSFRSLPPERDHIIVQVFINNQWVDLDLARDTDLDQGMRFLGIWHERRVLYREGPYDSLDEWLNARLKRRSVLKNRTLFFQTANEKMERIRQIGKIALKSGLNSWIDVQVREKLTSWELFSVPSVLSSSNHIEKISSEARVKLSEIKEPEARTSFENKLLDWLYALVRHNIKRGRVWELSDVLTQNRADCLGYARSLNFLTREFGLDSGIIEVVQDIRRRYVPHYVCIINLSNGTKRLLDPWYGSADMVHRTFIARLPGQPLPRTISMKALQKAGRIEGLASEQVAGLSFYILGNAYLGSNEVALAIECYDLSLWLYPNNPRTLYNRAIALEMLDKTEQARIDYQYAFSLPSAMMRIMATIEHIEPLIYLDEKAIDDVSQQIYLLRQGFITGHQMIWKEIAVICGLTPEKARQNYKATLNKLSADKAG